MSFVFFDIECASVYKTSAKICAFGYVVCDGQFNIIEKRDILINPNGKFHLTDGRGEHGLVLPYEYENFKTCPMFPQVFSRIKELLEDRNNIVFGHAAHNDVNYLDLETKRFHLSPLSFDFYDSQLMYMTEVGDFTRQFGLEYITKDLQVDFVPHRAADDAYATMKVVEALCKKHGCGIEGLIKLLRVKPGKIVAHRIFKPDTVDFAEYRRSVARAKKERAFKRGKFHSAVNRRHRPSSNKLKGRIFTFSRILEDEITLSIPLVEKIFEQGGKYVSKLSDCNVYVCADSDDSMRTASARGVQGLEIISIKALEDILNG